MRNFFKTLTFLLTGMFLLPVIARAQVPTITGVQLDIYKVSDQTKVITTLSITNPTCNLVASPANSAVVNPIKLEYNDPVNATKVCQVDISAAINALAADDYIGKAFFKYSDGAVGGTSTASNPFTRFFYALLTNLRFVR